MPAHLPRAVPPGPFSVRTSLAQQVRTGALLLGWTTPSPTQPFGFQPPAPEAPAAGKPLFAPPETHLMTIAPTGAGKGRSAIIPTLLTYPGQVVVIDPKAEALAVTQRHRATYGPVVSLNPYREATGHTDSLNVLDLWQFTGGHVEEAAGEITEALISGYQRSAKEPFWDNKAEALIAGVVAYILAHESPEDCTLPRLRTLLAGDPVYNLATLLDTTKDMNPFARQEISAFLSTTDVTRSGILSVAQQHVQVLGHPEVRTVLQETSFDLQDFVDGTPMTIYLNLPPTKLHSHGPLLRLWVSTLINLIVMCRDHRLALPTLFVIDEAAQLGALETLRQAMTLLRYKSIRTWTFWQDLSQLKRLYPDWETLLNNAGVVQTFGLTTYAMAEELATRLHRRKLAPETLLELGADEQVTLTPGGTLRRSQRPDYLADGLYEGLYDPNPAYLPAAPTPKPRPGTAPRHSGGRAA